MSEYHQLRLLKNNDGVTNSDSATSLYQSIVDTCDEIIEVLTDHCGKYALNCLLIEDSGMKSNNANMFTTDGITILDYLEYVSPLQTYIKHLIAYIGRRVETAAGDGTTTSMMISASILKYFFQKVISEQPLTKKNRHELIDKFKADISQLRTSLGHYRLTVFEVAEKLNKDPREIQSEIAYIQSMIISKGNKELSECIKEIFQYTPIEINDTFEREISRIETKEKFSVKYPDEDLTCNVVITSNIEYNKKLGTEFEQDNCDLIVSSALLTKDYKDYTLLYEYIKNRTKPVLVLYKEMSSDAVIELNSFNTRTGHPVILAKYASGRNISSTEPIILQTIPVASGKKSLHRVDNIEEAIITNVKCHIIHGKLSISNTYAIDEKTKLHMSYINPGSDENYDKFLKELKQTIHDFKHVHKVADNELIDEYVTSLRYMVSARTPRLGIGGNSIDVMESNAIVNDVLGAITCSLSKGFLIDGNLTTLKYSNSDFITKAFNDLLKVIHNITDKMEDTFNEIVDDYQFESGDKFDSKYMDLRFWERYCKTSVTKDGAINKFIVDGKLDHDAIIHPYVLYIELLNRIEEVIVKLMATERVIVPGTANDKGGK